MNAWRELDELVATKVMGLEHRTWQAYCAPEGWYPKAAPPCNDRDGNGNAIDADGYKSDCPFYSSDSRDAWEVVEHLGKMGYAVTIDHNLDYPAQIELWTPDGRDQKKSIEVFGESVPTVICLAALKAVGHEVNR